MWSLTPAVPAIALWDGVVSTLRVYSRDELMEMVRPLGDDFEWTWGRHKFAPGGNGYYFYGVRRP